MCSGSVLITYDGLISGEKKWSIATGVPKLQTPCSHVGKRMGEDSEKKSEAMGNGNGSREETPGREGQAG